MAAIVPRPVGRGPVPAMRKMVMMGGLTFPWIVAHGLRAMEPTSNSPLDLLITFIQVAVSAAACLIGYEALRRTRATRRSRIRDRAELGASATLTLVAVGMMGIDSFLGAFFGGLVPPVAEALLVSPAIALLPAAIVMPRVRLKDPQRIRVLVDGLMILSGAATFAWYFVAGPILERHWMSTVDEAAALLYPAMDVALVATLLVISAGTNRLPDRRWWPLAAGIALIIVSDGIRELMVSSSSGSAPTIVVGLRLVSSVFLAVAAVRFIEFPLVATSSPEDVKPPTNEGQTGTWSPRGAVHIWDSLLPYALVPVSAALAAYAWDKGLSSELTGGVLVGTSLLVALTFVRQLLAVKETRRLYEQVTRAYYESLTDAVSMETLNAELKRTKDQLQANNDALARANLSLQAQATTDPLTGLPNHRSMVLALDQELDRASRYSRPCSLLFLDLDHFKALNDSCGHLVGDSVLREMVTPILEGLRAADVAGRWGGEEFVIILPETEIGDAILAGERIRHLVSRHSFSVAGGAHITCSVGVASFPYDAGSRDDLIEAADRAMYAAKRLGRNQVRAAVDPSVIAFHSEIRHGSSREETSLWGIVEALTTIVKAHDSQEDAQSKQVAKLSMRVATSLGLSAPEVRMVGLAARLHDVGMVSVPQAVLAKPAALNSEDWSSVMAHPGVGAEVVASVPALSMLSPLIRSHHEWWDGSGYPDGLQGDDIPMGGRIISVCAAYCAITSGSARAHPRRPEQAMEELYECAGTQFDPSIVTALEDIVAAQFVQATAQAS